MRNDDGTLEFSVETMSTWEDFDDLLEYFKKRYQAEVLLLNDGPWGRRRVLEIRSNTIELRMDDRDENNYLLAPSKEDEPLLREIAEDLERRLTNGNLWGPS